MKIVHQDENTLILRPGEVILFIFLSLVSVGVGLLTMVEMGTEQHLVCERAQGKTQCQLTQVFLDLTLKTEPIAALQGARLDVHHGSKSDTYKPVLITANGEKSIGVNSNINVSKQRHFVEDINTYVQSPQLSRLDVMVGGASDLWVGAIFFLVGSGIGIMGIQAHFTTWTFDRLEGRVLHRRETLLGVKVNEYVLRDITGVHVATSRSRKGGYTYRVELETNDAIIPLSAWFSSGKSGKERAAQVISAFLQP